MIDAQKIRYVLIALLTIALADLVVNGSDAKVMAALGPIAGEAVGRGCPVERDLGAYGSAAIYDHTIRIEGSPEFVGRTMNALDRLYGTSGYRYAKALRRIVERHDGPRNANAWIHRGGTVANVSAKAARRSCTAYASTIAHEGAHALGHGEYGAYKVKAQVLQEFGESWAAFSANSQALMQSN
jgi:hypothetical protein